MTSKYIPDVSRFGCDICEIFNIDPKDVCDINMQIKVNELPRIIFTCFINDAKSNELKKIFKKYEIQAIND